MDVAGCSLPLPATAVLAMVEVLLEDGSGLEYTIIWKGLGK